MWGLCPGKDVGMSVSEAMTKRRRRSFSPEFKREIVALCQLPGNTVASVCKEYELAETAVRRWVRQAEIDAGLKPGTTTRGGGGDRPAAQAAAGGDRGARHSGPGRGFLRQGDPMSAQRSGVHRGGEAGRSQRRQGVRAARGVPFRLLRRGPARPSARELSDAELTEKIGTIHAASGGTYGAPRIHDELREQGWHVGKKRVARLMVAAGLAGRCRRRRTTHDVRRPEAKAMNLLARHFGPRT